MSILKQALKAREREQYNYVNEMAHREREKQEFYDCRARMANVVL
jgi:hypothetical protein